MQSHDVSWTCYVVTNVLKIGMVWPDCLLYLYLLARTIHVLHLPTTWVTTWNFQTAPFDNLTTK